MAKTLKPLGPWRFETPERALLKPKGAQDGEELDCASEANGSCAGFWRRSHAVEPGRFYELSAKARVFDGAPAAPEFVSAFVSWLTKEGKAVGKEPLTAEAEAGGLGFKRALQAPANAVELELSLSFRWRAGRLRWSGIEAKEIEAPRKREPLLVVTKIGPEGPSSKRANYAAMEEIFKRVERELEKPDLIVLPENLTTRRVAGALDELAEVWEGGESEAFLAKWAKRLRCHLYTTILERDGERFFNTGFMLGRDGSTLGRYRKIHLTLSEAERGLSAGDEWKVFELDFGKVGVATCWDNWFSESARILRLMGAEIIAFPLAGDGDPAHWEPVWKARAIDNGIHLASATSIGEDPRCPARIIAPDGAVLAEANEPVSYAAARIDLDRKFTTYWLSVGPCDGEGRALYCAERRPSTYGILTTPAPR